MWRWQAKQRKRVISPSGFKTNSVRASGRRHALKRFPPPNPRGRSSSPFFFSPRSATRGAEDASVAVVVVFFFFFVPVRSGLGRNKEAAVGATRRSLPTFDEGIPANADKDRWPGTPARPPRRTVSLRSTTSPPTALISSLKGEKKRWPFEAFDLPTIDRIACDAPVNS